ncbi:MAG: hypothetical protein M3451_10660 [Chloroflexota bacterium]|nr:hypothetical protein [Chloroflexota bacterium]
MLALAGAIGMLYLSDIVTADGSGPTWPVAIGLTAPLVLACVLMLLPSTRDNSLIWLVTGAWCEFLAALTIWSVGIVFLVVAVLLLAAFLTANWGH